MGPRKPFNKRDILVGFDIKAYQHARYIKNKVKLKRRAKRYYKEHKAAYSVRNRAAKERGRAFLLPFKSVPCVDCGRCFPSVCMDFDHRPGEQKIFEIGPNTGLSKERLAKEIVKCDVVCACCHRIRTFSRLREKKHV